MRARTAESIANTLRFKVMLAAREMYIEGKELTVQSVSERSGVQYNVTGPNLSAAVRAGVMFDDPLRRGNKRRVYCFTERGERLSPVEACRVITRARKTAESKSKRKAKTEPVMVVAGGHKFQVDEAREIYRALHALFGSE